MSEHVHEFMVYKTEVRRLWEPAELRLTTGGPRFARRWIKCLLRAALRWMGAEVGRDEHVRTFVRASGDTILQRMRLSSSDMERLYNDEARYAFVGPDVLYDIEREAREVMSMMSLGPLDARIYREGRVKTVDGVEIVYVPWMTGALLVPEWRKP